MAAAADGRLYARRRRRNGVMKGLALAATLATEVSPRSLRVMKRQLWEAPFQDLAGAVRLANDEMVDSLRSADFQEGIAHFVEKRQAAFTGQ